MVKMVKKEKLITMIATCLVVVVLYFVLFTGHAIGAQKNDDDYPNKEIRIILGVSVGGAMETSARTLQPYLQEELGVPVVIDCIPGAGGIIGSNVALGQEADGYTFVMMPFSFLAGQVLIYDAPYNIEDFKVVSNFVYDPNVIMVHKDSKWQTIEELIEFMKEQPPGLVSISICDLVDPAMLCLLELQEEMGVEFNIIPFGGGNPARIALAGGHVDATAAPLYAAQHINEYARVIGVAQEKNLWPEFSNNAPTINDALGINIRSSQDTISIYALTDFYKQYPKRAEIFEDKLLRALNNEDYRKKIEAIGQTGRIIARGSKESQELQDEVVELYKDYISVFERYGIK